MCGQCVARDRLGVRLGTGPGLEEAEGNSETKVDIKGTYL